MESEFLNKLKRFAKQRKNRIVSVVTFVLVSGFALTASANDSAQPATNELLKLSELQRLIAAQQEQITALQQELSTVITELETVRIALETDFISVEAHREQIRLSGLDPVVRRSIVRTTRGFWAGGTAHRDRTCAEIPSHSDYVNFTSSKWERVSGRGTCQVAPFCDSHGEVCHDEILSVCQVRKDLVRIARESGSSDEAIRDQYCG